MTRTTRRRHAARLGIWLRQRLTIVAARWGLPSDPPIRCFLDLSTAHLQQQTCDQLDGYHGVIAYETTYGWLMYAPRDDTGLAAAHGWPAELLPIIRLARANGCAYVLFDSDAEQSSQLPIFDW
jgi:hypothetical protein